MNFEQAYRFITDDEDWLKKIGFGAVLWLTGIGVIALLGWSMEIMRRVSTDEENPLPDWTEIGQYFVNGLKFFVLTFVWTLPAILFIFCASFSIIFTSAQFADPNDAVGLPILMMLCSFVVILVNMVFLALVAPPAMGLIAEGAPLASLFIPRASWDLAKANLGGYLLSAIIGNFVVNLLAMLGIFLCGIGFFFGGSFGYAFWAHLAGQAHAQAKSNLALAGDQPQSVIE